MQDAYAYCEALVREADRDRYLATLFIPRLVRRHAFAIYAFNAEVASVRERASQPMAGEIRLQWWRDALAGRAGGDVASNPVAAALLETVGRQELPRSVLENLIEARAFDLYDDPMTTIAALEGYLRATASSLFELVVRLSGDDEAPVRDAAHHAGLAFGVAGILRAFPLHASRGQIYLPDELLVRRGVRPEEILSGKTSDALRAVLAEMCGLARAHLVAANQLIPGVPAAARAAFLPLTLVDPYLRQMEREGYDPFRTPVDIPQWRRQWILWREARQIP